MLLWKLIKNARENSGRQEKTFYIIGKFFFNYGVKNLAFNLQPKMDWNLKSLLNIFFIKKW